MKKRPIILLILALAVIVFLIIFFLIRANSGPPFEENQSEFSNLDIKKAIYSDYKIPSGFLEEESSAGFISYLNQEISYFCSDSPNLTETLYENNNFFYYIENNTEYRIIKCGYVSYLDNIYYKEGLLFVPFDTNITKLIGNYSKNPKTKEEVKELIEFLGFNRYKLNSNKILSSFTEEFDEFFRHTLFQTRLIEGNNEFCDKIFLIKVIYDIEKANGAIYHIETRTIKQINGRC